MYTSLTCGIGVMAMHSPLHSEPNCQTFRKQGYVNEIISLSFVCTRSQVAHPLCLWPNLKKYGRKSFADLTPGWGSVLRPRFTRDLIPNLDHHGDQRTCKASKNPCHGLCSMSRNNSATVKVSTRKACQLDASNWWFDSFKSCPCVIREASARRMKKTQLFNQYTWSITCNILQHQHVHNGI